LKAPRILNLGNPNYDSFLVLYQPIDFVTMITTVSTPAQRRPAAEVAKVVGNRPKRLFVHYKTHRAFHFIKTPEEQGAGKKP
jgi:hypothetical protein